MEASKIRYREEILKQLRSEGNGANSQATGFGNQRRRNLTDLVPNSRQMGNDITNNQNSARICPPCAPFSPEVIFFSRIINLPAY